MRADKVQQGIPGFLLKISAWIDDLNQRIGRLVSWLVLVVVIISAGNAVIRYVFDLSSNAWLEVQWYLFAAIFLLGAGDALRQNDHIRIDIFYNRLSVQGQRRVDFWGTLLFLMPVVTLIAVLSVPMVMAAFQTHEVSPNAGGLVRWPVKILVPVGFGLLWLQGVSQLIKASIKQVITSESQTT